MDYWEILDYLGTYRWDSSPFSWESFDFQIDRWIAKGKLHWIEPGDRTFTLRQGTDKCPYLTFAGTKNIQMIRNGELIDTGEQEGK